MMWTDIFTKPLQERAFREFRSELINCSDDYKEEITCEDVNKITVVFGKKWFTNRKFQCLLHAII